MSYTINGLCSQLSFCSSCTNFVSLSTTIVTRSERITVVAAAEEEVEEATMTAMILPLLIRLELPNKPGLRR